MSRRNHQRPQRGAPRPTLVATCTLTVVLGGLGLATLADAPEPPSSVHRERKAPPHEHIELEPLLPVVDHSSLDITLTPQYIEAGVGVITKTIRLDMPTVQVNFQF
jgi:hypothetical protein